MKCYRFIKYECEYALAHVLSKADNNWVVVYACYVEVNSGRSFKKLVKTGTVSFSGAGVAQSV
jgi:hypothetical protein